MSPDEFKRIIYDLHHENRQDIRDMRKDIGDLRVVVEGILVRSRTRMAIFGAVGGISVTLVGIAIKLIM